MAPDSPNPALRCLLLSDSNVDNLAALLERDQSWPPLKPVVAPFGEVVQTVMNANAAVWAEDIDSALVWTRPEGALPAFDQLRRYESVADGALDDDVAAFCGVLARLAERVRAVFVPIWVLPPSRRGLGMLDLAHDRGLAHALLRMNARLADGIRGIPNVFLLDTARWMTQAGAPGHNPKAWYLGKIAFGAPVFRHAVQDIKAALRGLAGRARKVVILDLDDTLWGGIVGDVGWQQLRLGGHDPVGEAYVDFQRELLALTRRGVILAIASKNEEAVALEAIDEHPEMVLGRDHFAAWRINWDDKATNVLDLLEELNLGPDAAVFIDDNPAERARVAEAVPSVLVPEWPNDAQLYPAALAALDCFDTPAFTDEDQQRARMYVTDRQRRSLRANVQSLDEWLAQLDVTVAVDGLTDGNRPRATQLLNKTNQMNLTTRRLTEPELVAWAGQPGHAVWTFRVSDKYGEAGLVGLVSVEIDGAVATIVDFILSCRVFGRRIEETMVHKAVSHAIGAGAHRVRATYLPTPKNKPCLTFWAERSGFAPDEPNRTFSWDAATPYPLPDGITLHDATTAS